MFDINCGVLAICEECVSLVYMYLMNETCKMSITGILMSLILVIVRCVLYEKDERRYLYILDDVNKKD